MEVNRIFLLGILALIGGCHSSEFNCNPIVDVSTDYGKTVCYVTKCATKIEAHIKEELNAAFHYMYLATYFDQDSVNRHGLAKFLYESASEERHHAIMMLDYLNERGIPFNEKYLLREENFALGGPITYKKTLEAALNMEIKVTDAIHKIIDACEEDFHGADVFTEPILAEQHNGIRKLQGALRTFDDLSSNAFETQDVAFAEYMFDQKMINGEIF